MSRIRTEIKQPEETCDAEEPPEYKSVMADSSSDKSELEKLLVNLLSKDS